MNFIFADFHTCSTQHLKSWQWCKNLHHTSLLCFRQGSYVLIERHDSDKYIFNLLPWWIYTEDGSNVTARRPAANLWDEAFKSSFTENLLEKVIFKRWAFIRQMATQRYGMVNFGVIGQIKANQTRTLWFCSRRVSKSFREWRLCVVSHVGEGSLHPRL